MHPKIGNCPFKARLHNFIYTNVPTLSCIVFCLQGQFFEKKNLVGFRHNKDLITIKDHREFYCKVVKFPPFLTRSICRTFFAYLLEYYLSVVEVWLSFRRRPCISVLKEESLPAKYRDHS